VCIGIAGRRLVTSAVTVVEISIKSLKLWFFNKIKPNRKRRRGLSNDGFERHQLSVTSQIKADIAKIARQKSVV